MTAGGYGDGSGEDGALVGEEVHGDGCPAAKRLSRRQGGDAWRHAREQGNREERDEVRLGFAGVGRLI